MCYYFETVLEILYSIQISIFQYLTNQGDKIPFKWSGNTLLFHFMEDILYEHLLNVFVKDWIWWEIKIL